MATGATGQLGLALPVQGELSGTWGDTVNNGITQYTNIAIAGTLTLTGDGAVTLANTTGDASASNITSTLTGAGTVTAQFAIVRVTGTLTTPKIITGPSYSKTYVVVNAATGSTVSFIRSGQTPAVSIAVGETAFVYYNGTDYVKLTGTATAGAAGGSTTQVQFNSSGVLAGSANLTWDGTNLTSTGFSGPHNGTVGATTANTGAFTTLSATGVATFSAGTVSLPAITTSGDTNTGIFFPAADTIAFTEGGVESMRIDASGNLGLGVTPSAWISSYRTFSLGDSGFISSRIGASVNDVAVGVNWFRNSGGSFVYKANGFATNYGQQDGVHSWYNAPNNTSGAGAALTLTQAMTLDASGNLLVGATSVAIAERLNVVGGNGIRVNEDGAGTKIITIRSNYAGTAPAINVTTDDPLLFLTNNTERARFTGSAGGSLLMGTTTLRTTGYTTGNSQYAMETTGYGGAQWFVNRADDEGTYIVLGKSRGTTVNSNTVVANADTLGAVIWEGTTGSGVVAAAQVRAKVDGSTINASSMPGRLEFYTTASGSTTMTERLRIASTGAFGLSGANYGTSGQVLTSGGSGAAPTWTTVSGGASAATPTALGTVYGSMTTSGGTPFLTALGYNAGLNNTGTNNVFVGLSAGQANTSGGSNVALGYGALDVNTTSSSSVAIGADALGQASVAISGFGGETVAIGYRAFYSLGTVASNSSGGCTAIGHAAGYSTSSAGNGAYDTFIGYLAGYYNVSGYGCTFVGAQAGFGQTSGNNNTIVGQNAGRQTSGAGGGNNTFVGTGSGSGNSGNDNTFVGTNAGSSNAGASENTYFGTYAAQSCTGGQNVAVGKGAMYSSVAANYNTAIGRESLYSNISGSYHTAVGWMALNSATDNSNVAVGYQAGRGVTSGHSNVLLGTNAAYATVITTGGALNVVIGSGAYTNTAGAYQEIVIGAGCNGLGNDRVSIGKLNSRIWAQYDSSGSWTYASDARLKKDIENDSLGLSFINKLRPVTYRWKATNELELDNPQYNEVNNKNTTVVMHGLIAQEVKAALDEEGVSTFAGWAVESNGIQSVSREMFITPLINAVQELSAQIETLKAEIAALKGA